MTDKWYRDSGGPIVFLLPNGLRSLSRTDQGEGTACTIECRRCQVSFTGESCREFRCPNCKWFPGGFLCDKCGWVAPSERQEAHMYPHPVLGERGGRTGQANFRLCYQCYGGKSINRYIYDPFEGLDFEIGRIDLPKEMDTRFLAEMADKLKAIDAYGCSCLAELESDDCGGAYRILACDGAGDPVTDQRVLDLFKETS